MTKPRVLVTGATGCIGRQLLPMLAEHGWEVHAVSFGPEFNDAPEAQWHEADMLVPGNASCLIKTAAPSALVHLAWSIAPGKWAEAPENIDWVCASLELAREFVRSGGSRLVVAGSCLEYDWNYGYCSEQRTPCVPHTLYGTAKNALRLLLEPFTAQSNCSMAWGRIFFLYGPHEHPDRIVSSVVRSLLKGIPARCSHGRQVRDYLYARDVARALLSLLESDIRGPINIASGQPITLRSIVERIGELIGRRELIQLGSIPAAPTDTPLVVGDVSRLNSDLSWSPQYSLDDGLMETIDWWRRHQT